MKKIAIGILLNCLALNVYAETKQIETPTGAFGISFGEDLSNLKVIKDIKLKDGEIIYQVNVPKPLSNKFDYYWVSVTPKTKKVSVISGYKEYKLGQRDLCISDKDAIVVLLENKYGEFKIDEDMMNINKNKYKNINEVKIYATCATMGGNSILAYTNENYLKQQQKEKEELLIENTDSDML